MDFNEYQQKTNKTVKNKNANTMERMFYLGLGINDEAGEVAGKLKKFIRDEEVTSLNSLSTEQKEALMYEVGDVLWYIAQLAENCEYTLEHVAEMNIEKLFSRLERDKIGGSGDNR